jgi:pyruvate kinase
MRRTKIIATVGPATATPAMLEKLLRAGVDLFRINYSHQTHADHARCARHIRRISSRLGIEVGIIADLQGPKIRIQRFRDGPVSLSEGANFTLDTALGPNAGNAGRVGVSYRQLPRDVRPGDTLLLDDGRIVLTVTGARGGKVRCRVKVGGELASNKGINILGGGLSAKSLTAKDRRDLAHGISIGADYFAVSFVRNPADIRTARRLIKRGGSRAGVIAKLERAEAIENARTIIREADAIMIARGDLGVEIGDAALPPVQKNLIRMARQMDRVVITATQMMESMIDSQIPLRAEVFDVANAVLDGTDAVMLSGETSIGKYPDQVVAAMARICEETEKQRDTRVSDHRINQQFTHIEQAIAMAAMYTANHTGTRAIAALTETGSTCRWMSRISSGIPIYAFTRNLDTERKLRLYRGVYPVHFDITHTDPLQANTEIIRELAARDAVDNGDIVIITKGDLRGRRGKTNNMKIVQVGKIQERMT